MKQCFRKKSHPRNKFEGQGYEETVTPDCLNVFDNTETRTPILVVEVRNEKSNSVLPKN